MTTCNTCGLGVCNCPPKLEIGCLVPCVPNTLTFPLGFIPNTCTDLKTENLDSVQLVVLERSAEGNVIVFNKDSVTSPSAFDLTGTYKVDVNFLSADTTGFNGTKTYYYEFYVVFQGEAEPTLLHTGKLCVEALRTSDLAPMNVAVEYSTDGKHVLFTVEATTPHVGYTLDNYVWDFGDGDTPQIINHPTNDVSHLYDTEGEYEVTVTVQASNDGSNNPCVPVHETTFTFNISICGNDTNPFKPASVRECNYTYFDVKDFVTVDLDTGNVPYPLYYYVSFTGNGTVYANRTRIKLEKREDLELGTVAPNNFVNVATFLNNLSTPFRFDLDIVDTPDLGQQGIQIGLPTTSSTFNLTIENSYTGVGGETYFWTESLTGGGVVPINGNCVDLP